ncbi:MAG: 2-dehydro-3-deoxyglucarate aldolase [Thermoproteota archaeon]|nr:2-dehydro-3-deoxyglucarate aldolase [Thermoproteota archaeon]
MSLNVVKELLKDGKVAVGTSCGPRDPVALLAEAGFDHIFFDTQHAPVDIKELVPAMQAMKGKRAVPIIRVGENDPALICYALDIGAKGVIIPMVDTREDAERAVRSCKYPPEGNRSGAMTGAVEYWGTFKTFRDYSAAANSGVLVLPQIETAESVKNIDEITSVSGIDVALVGPLDLSVSMGLTEDYGNPKYQEALDKVVRACKKTGVTPGAWFIPGAIDPNKFIAKGFRLFTMGWRPYLMDGVKNRLEKIRR